MHVRPNGLIVFVLCFSCSRWHVSVFTKQVGEGGQGQHSRGANAAVRRMRKGLSMRLNIAASSPVASAAACSGSTPASQRDSASAAASTSP